MSEQSIVQYMQSDMVRSRFSDVLGNANSGAYIAGVLLAVANDPTGQLRQCTPESIYTSALRAASLRLSVDQSLGQAHLVPYNGRATLIIGYKGLYDLAIRTGKYRYINVGHIYEGESVVEDRITGFHRIEGGKRSNTIIGWIGAFEMRNGFAKTIYMTVEEIHDHAKKYSRSYDNPRSLWKTDPHKMERKTILRILLRKWGYLDPQDAAVMEQIEEEAQEAESVATAEREIEDTVEGVYQEADVSQNGSNESGRPYPPETVREKIRTLAEEFEQRGEKPSEGQKSVLPRNLEMCFAGMSESEKIRRSVMRYLTGKESTKDLTDGEVLALRRWLNVRKDSGGEWLPDPMAEREANLIWREAQVEAGQLNLSIS